MAGMLLVLFLAASAGGQEAKEPPKAAVQASAPREIVPPPLEARASTGLLVFLGWMWLAILVLVWILGMKIREADRLREIGYFEGPGDSPGSVIRR